MKCEFIMAMLPLKHFISQFNESYGIRDMSIEALPIDAVMKECYIGTGQKCEVV